MSGCLTRIPLLANPMEMNRKEFLQTLGVAGTAFAAGTFDTLDTFAQTEAKDGPVDLVAVMDGEPAPMLRKAISELGGIERFVKKGQKIVVKPNIAWDQPPEVAANTNPELVGELVKMILAAGAAEVVVYDSTCDKADKSYKNSGVEKAVKDAGGKMAPADDDRYFTEVPLPKGVKLKSAMIHKSIIDCDAWFNVPVLKVHGGARMTIAMKNCMGLVSKSCQQSFHKIDLQQCIADVCTYEKKPVLNIVDAYRILKANGPRGKSVADAVLVKALLASTDIVAIDTASTKLAQKFTNVPLEDVGHIHAGQQLGLGTTDIEKLNVRRVKV
ncbi:MAG: DUF362 domain-containing protein [Planctomycetaceae bacterium]|jgi:uncharacterized protein (DUF362 family)|nr:DUF362 domain-containing protein [Planctomycetaceae bacterium]